MAYMQVGVSGGGDLGHAPPGSFEFVSQKVFVMPSGSILELEAPYLLSGHLEA